MESLTDITSQHVAKTLFLLMLLVQFALGTWLHGVWKDQQEDAARLERQGLSMRVYNEKMDQLYSRIGRIEGRLRIGDDLDIAPLPRNGSADPDKGDLPN